MKIFNRLSNGTTTSPKTTINLFLSTIFVLSFNMTGLSSDHDHENELCNNSISELMASNLKEYNGKSVTLNGIELQSTQLIYMFYKANNYEAAWTNQNELTPQAKVLFNLFENSYMYGIEPSILNVEELSTYIELLKNESKQKKVIRYRAQIELLLTNSAFTFMLTLSNGNQYSDPEVIANNIKIINTLPEYLSSIISSGNIELDILALQPQDDIYAGLQHEMGNLVRYIDLLESKVEDLKIYIPLFEFLASIDGYKPEKLGLSDEDYLQELISQYQTNNQIRETGNVTATTRHNISISLISQYAELAYQIEMIRSENNINNLVALYN